MELNECDRYYINQMESLNLEPFDYQTGNDSMYLYKCDTDVVSKFGSISPLSVKNSNTSGNTLLWALAIISFWLL